MTAYHPTKVALLLSEVRSRYARCGAVATADALDMADQLEALELEYAEAKRDVLLQAARLAALESELATLQASVVDAMSSAGPEVPEDERAP